MTISICYQTINWQQMWYQNLMIPPMTNTTKCVYDWLNQSCQNLTKPLTNFYQQEITFIPQSQLPENVAYETHIAKTGQIPTRDNWHDLLNGIIWLNFPKTKAIFNQLHHQDIAKNGVQASRSTLRNILTLFDENGGVVVSSQRPILQSLRNFDWKKALFDERKQWQGEQKNTIFFPVGHALLEKLIQPRHNITSHLLLVLVKDDWFSLTTIEQRQQLDEYLSEFFYQLGQLDDNLLTAKMFQPLPVLGIAGFCQENQQLEFYQDITIFRQQAPRPQVNILLFNQ